MYTYCFERRQMSGFPQGLENKGKNNGRGKVREFYFGPKVRERSGIFFILGQKSGYFFINYHKYRESISQVYLFHETRTTWTSMVTLNQYYVTFRELSLMSISWYECEIMTQIHHFGCHGLSVAMIYGQGKIAKNQGISFSRSCGNPECKKWRVLYMQKQT